MHVGIGAHQLGEGLAGLPALHGQTLHGLISLLARQAGGDEGGEHALGEVQAVGTLHVLLHALGLDHQAVQQAAQAVEHVVGQDGGVGHDDALHGRMADVALVPQGLVLHGSHGIAADQAGKAGHVLGGDGVLLVRHGRGALLALGEAFFHFQHLGALQMAQLHAQAFDAAGQDGQGGEEMGIAVTLHDLGGVRVHGQAQTGQGLFLQFGGKEGVGAHGAGDLAHAHALDTGLDALQMALELGVEAGHLEAEAGGFGMDAVGAAHAEHALVLAGQGFQRSQHLFDVFHDELAGLHEQIAVGGVHDVGRRTAQMDVAGVGAHLFFQRSEEGDDVVTGGLLDLEDAVHVDVGLFPDGLHGLGGHAAQFGPGLAHGHFHSQPGAVTVLQGPDAAHGGPGVALNHRYLTRKGSTKRRWKNPSLRKCCWQCCRKKWNSSTRRRKKKGWTCCSRP